MKLLKNMNASPEQGRDSVTSVEHHSIVNISKPHVGATSFNPQSRVWMEQRSWAAASKSMVPKKLPSEIQKAKNAITQLQAALVANETSHIPDRMSANQIKEAQ